MATALKACRRGGSCLLLPYRRDYSHGFFSSTSSSYTAKASPSLPSHLDFCRQVPGLGLPLRTNLLTGFRLRSGVHFTDSGLRSPLEHRFFSSHGGSDEDKKGTDEEMDDDDDDEELSVEDDGDEEENEDGDGDDDELQLVSDTQTPLPNFKDRTEEAAYIGYKVIGSVKAGDFGQLKAPKAFAVVQVGSHQFKISPGDCIYTEKLKFADVNDKVQEWLESLVGRISIDLMGDFDLGIGRLVWRDSLAAWILPCTFILERDWCNTFGLYLLSPRDAAPALGIQERTVADWLTVVFYGLGPGYSLPWLEGSD